jgi:hypothetical protein
VTHRDPDEMPDDNQREIMCLIADALISVGAPWAMIRQELLRMTFGDKPPWDHVPAQRTLERMMLAYFECDSMTELRAKRKDTVAVTLKAKAVMMALQGNPTMLIFCLKNLAGWSDNVKPVPTEDEAKNIVKLAYERSKLGGTSA